MPSLPASFTSVLLFLLPAACGAGEDLTHPSLGGIQVITVTVGGPSGAGGYQVVVDGRQVVDLGAADTAAVAGLEPGERRVELVGMAPSCSVEGINPRVVTVLAGIEVEASFRVVCADLQATGTLEVFINSSGTPADPDGYTILVDPGVSLAAVVGSTATIAGLATGDHAVRLDDVAAGCSVASKNPRTVTIEAEAVTRTEFDIVCRGPVQGRIAFVSDRDAAGFGFDIFVRNADGTGLTNLTKTPEARERRPAWSPNGKRIAFDNDFSDDAVNLINPDGSGRTTLHTGIPGVWGPKWSPDGNKIAFLSVGPTGGLGVINVDGSRPILIASSDAIEDFAWSPDGRKVAFGRLRFDPSTVTAIWIVNSDGNGSVQLTADRTEADLRVYGWSPDGRWIAFVAPTPGRDGEDIYLVDPATKAEVNITNNPDEYPSVAWSPDGSTLAFTRKRGGGAGSDLRDIFTIKADGSGLTNITNAPDAYGDVEWSPDGQRLVFVFGFFALDIINADGSDRRLLTADTLSDFEPSWGP